LLWRHSSRLCCRFEYLRFRNKFVQIASRHYARLNNKRNKGQAMSSRQCPSRFATSNPTAKSNGHRAPSSCI
jgi:hypothetical protein